MCPCARRQLNLFLISLSHSLSLFHFGRLSTRGKFGCHKSQVGRAGKGEAGEAHLVTRMTLCVCYSVAGTSLLAVLVLVAVMMSQCRYADNGNLLSCLVSVCVFSPVLCLPLATGSTAPLFGQQPRNGHMAPECSSVQRWAPRGGRVRQSSVSQ